MGVTPLATRHASCAALVVIGRFAAGIFVDGEVSASPFFFVEMSRERRRRALLRRLQRLLRDGSLSRLPGDRKAPGDARDGMHDAVPAGRNLIYKELP